MIFTESSIVQYVSQLVSGNPTYSPLSQLFSNSCINHSLSLTATTIKGGNINYSFSILDTNSGIRLFVKHAPDYVAVLGPGVLPLSTNRMKFEWKAYQEWNKILGPQNSFLPQIYHFDSTQMILIVEFLDRYQLLENYLRTQLVQPVLLNNIATALGSFLGQTHAATHSSKVSYNEWMDKFKNRDMRALQLDYVFTKCYQESTHDMGRDFEQDINQLKYLYSGLDATNLVLCHGDLHPGSVMIQVDSNPIQVKLIDPEFAMYGPPGLDIGSLFSGFIFAAIFRTYSTLSSHSTNNHEVIIDQIDCIIQAMKCLWSTYSTIMTHKGISVQFLNDIQIQVCGFALAEVCRVVLGFAGQRSWLKFDDEAIQGRAVDTAIHMAKKCMYDRHTQGIQCIIEELKKLPDELLHME